MRFRRCLFIVGFAQVPRGSQAWAKASASAATQVAELQVEASSLAASSDSLVAARQWAGQAEGAACYHEGRQVRKLRKGEALELPSLASLVAWENGELWARCLAEHQVACQAA